MRLHRRPKGCSLALERLLLGLDQALPQTSLWPRGIDDMCESPPFLCKRPPDCARRLSCACIGLPDGLLNLSTSNRQRGEKKSVSQGSSRRCFLEGFRHKVGRDLGGHIYCTDCQFNAGASHLSLLRFLNAASPTFAREVLAASCEKQRADKSADSASGSSARLSCHLDALRSMP